MTEPLTTWRSKELGDGVAALGPSQLIRDAFFQLIKSGNSPAGIAVFSRYALQRNMVTVYFTPGAADMARMFGAEPCAKPHRGQRGSDKLGYLGGDERCWGLIDP